jgi:hypothetical protein
MKQAQGRAPVFIPAWWKCMGGGVRRRGGGAEENNNNKVYFDL